MHSALRYFIVFFSLLALTSCKKPIPDPENLDSIYRDLKGLADAKKKELEEARKNRDSAYLKIDKEKPNTLEKKLARKEFEKAEAKITSLEQQARYLAIRAERRKMEDRVNYLEAFRKDLPWPDKNEYSAWITNRNLAEAPTTWGKDLPKLYDTAKKPEKKKETKAE